MKFQQIHNMKRLKHGRDGSGVQEHDSHIEVKVQETTGNEREKHSFDYRMKINVGTDNR